ncbi:MAG TPA: thioredoxin family protein [Candidatus Dormibacteraeota bacterium]|nr:thioredoxin family protein [Candidatus Dormibacteraeota bacterium]
MGSRLAVLALAMGGLLLLWALVRGGAAWRASRRVNRLRDPGLTAGRPTVLFFTGERCGVCKYRQRPALDRLVAERDGLNVVELDAARESKLARRFGVLSLPTTVVMAADGRVGAVNYGYAPREQLGAQLDSVAS